MLFRMKDEKAHQLEAELDKLQADGPAAWAKLPEEELFTPAGFSEERAEATSYSNYSYWGSTFRAFFKNRVAVLLLIALIAVVAFAFLQPCLPGQADPNLCAVDPATGIQYRNIAPGEKGFIWGSNAIGQDLWARIWAGARTSLTIAFFVALIEAVVGITVGVLWGYVRQLDFFFILDLNRRRCNAGVKQYTLRGKGNAAVAADEQHAIQLAFQPVQRVGDVGLVVV